MYTCIYVRFVYVTVILFLRSFREINIYEEWRFRIRSVITPIALGHFEMFLRVKRRTCNIFIRNQICCDISLYNMGTIIIQQDKIQYQ